MAFTSQINPKTVPALKLSHDLRDMAQEENGIGGRRGKQAQTKVPQVSVHNYSAVI